VDYLVRNGRLLYHKYHNSLDIEAQDSVCLGYNSVLDLSTETERKSTLSSLFSQQEWDFLKAKHEQKWTEAT
jgi:hypothetical protein